MDLWSLFHFDSDSYTLPGMTGGPAPNPNEKTVIRLQEFAVNDDIAFINFILLVILEFLSRFVSIFYKWCSLSLPAICEKTKSLYY